MNLERLRLRLVAGDPGWVRLVLALRAVLTVSLGIVAARCLPHSSPVLATAAIYLSLLLCLMVQQRATLWWCGLAAVPQYLFACSLEAGYGYFVLLAGLSFWLGKFGMRSATVGSILFFTFVVARALPVAPEHFGQAAAAIVLGTAIVHVVKFWLLPDRPERTLRGTYQAFCAEVELRRGDRLHEVALALDEQLRILGAGELRQKLLEAELQVERGEVPTLDWTLPAVPPGTLLGVLFYRPVHLPERLPAVAAQVVVAGALAVGLGRAFTPERWYWCAIASYTVFLQVRTVGDSWGRALGRMAGTGLGIVAGVAVSVCLPHGLLARLAGVLVFLFGSYYMSLISIFWMIFGGTVALSLLYSLGAQAPLELLSVRFLSISLGSLVGMAVALTVFPLRTDRRARQQASQLLDKIVELEGRECSLAELRQVDLLVFELRRLGTSGSLIPARLPATSRLVRATTDLRRYLVRRDEEEFQAAVARVRRLLEVP